MLLTGTSVSALARGIGRGLRAIFRGAFAGGDAAARTVVKTHAEWREHRDARAEAATLAGATDVMSSYPEEDDDFEPTVALAEEDDFDAQVFDDAEAETETQVLPAEDERGGAEPEPSCRTTTPRSVRWSTRATAPTPASPRWATSAA